MYSLDQRSTDANPVLLAMWGKSWDESIGKNCLELGCESFRQNGATRSTLRYGIYRE